MERMRTLGLKQAFFLLTLGCLALSLLLAGGCWMLCDALGRGIPSGGVTIEASGTVVALAQPTPQQARVLSVLGWGQILACLFLPVLGLGAAGAIFYRWKLKRPIALLREGTERILRHELDFSLPAQPQDELGQLCAAFETMRAELLRTNRELWRQAEERKRLNAAFSHDLRNPITVLKGSLKLLRQGVESEQALRRLEDYMLRMERYVEAMGGIARLEQLPLTAEAVSLPALRAELAESAALLSPGHAVEILGPDEGVVSLDRGLFMTVAENLLGNAARFARRDIRLRLSRQGDTLTLQISDDGPGYPAALLKDGPRPFQGTEEGATHLGMGLYSCLTLCQKHGGQLQLQNAPGAVATATFREISALNNL